MKKILLSLAVAFSSLTPLSALAQAPASDTPACPANKECKAPGARKDRKARNPFASVPGITAEQQSRLDALSADRQKTREARRAENMKARAERQKADSASRAEFRAKRKADRDAYLAQVKAILTPEQYVAWLENMAFNRPEGSRADRKKFAGNRKDGRKDGRKGHRHGNGGNGCPAAHASK